MRHIKFLVVNMFELCVEIQRKHWVSRIEIVAAQYFQALTLTQTPTLTPNTGWGQSPVAPEILSVSLR